MPQRAEAEAAPVRARGRGVRSRRGHHPLRRRQRGAAMRATRTPALRGSRLGGRGQRRRGSGRGRRSPDRNESREARALSPRAAASDARGLVHHRRHPRRGEDPCAGARRRGVAGGVCSGEASGRTRDPATRDAFGPEGPGALRRVLHPSQLLQGVGRALPRERAPGRRGPVRRLAASGGLLAGARATPRPG